MKRLQGLRLAGFLVACLLFGGVLGGVVADAKDALPDLRRKLLEAGDSNAVNQALYDLSQKIGEEGFFPDHVAFGEWLGRFGYEGGLSLSLIFGWIFAPVAWCMGVQGWGDCRLFGTLLGFKVTVNEFVAFGELQRMLPLADGAVESISASGEVVRHLADPRHAKMAAYALCGFANFASVGIQMGGIPPLAPDRKADIARLALRAMVGGAFASWMTATVAGMFL